MTDTGKTCSGITKCGSYTLNFLDVNGQNILKFIKMSDGQWYGGTTHPNHELYYGPHCWTNDAGIMDLISKLANMQTDIKSPAGWYSLGDFFTPIKSEMRASDIATALKVDEQKVRDHFENVVKVA